MNWKEEKVSAEHDHPGALTRRASPNVSVTKLATFFADDAFLAADAGPGTTRAASRALIVASRG